MLVAAETVSACVCAITDNTVLGRYEEAQFVVIAKAVSVEKVPEVKTSYSGDEEIKRAEMVVKSATMVVEKVYKGDLKAGRVMIFGQGEIGSCFETFDEDDVGAKYLFYLKPREKTEKVWHADICGRSKRLPGFETGMIDDAADDLTYLDRMDEVRGKTRVSGTLISYQWSPSHGGADFKKLAGRRVRLVGEKGTYEAETNGDGVYEIYDLPPGRYTVEPEVPRGWEIDKDSAWSGSGSSGGGDDDRRSQVTVKENRHAYFNFFFKVDNRVRGRVLDPSGRPLAGVCVELLPNQDKVSEHFEKADCTKEDGSFEMAEIPFGGYLLVVNKKDRVSPDEPFRRFYYPGVREREKARVITVVEGEEPEALDVRVPEMREVVAVEGIFLSSDGRPVVSAGVYFEAEEADGLTEGDAFARTGEDGKFSIKVLKGLSGKLSGVVILSESGFRDCPQIVALLRAKGEIERRAEETEAVEIHARGNLAPVELRLPFPSCKGAKIFSQVRID